MLLSCVIGVLAGFLIPFDPPAVVSWTPGLLGADPLSYDAARN